MSLKSFENYARLASNFDVNDTEMSGRYKFQAQEERNILPDVIRKLCINPTDSLLEIGCGPGNLLIPLSYLVDSAAGNDNDPVLKQLLARCGPTGKIKTLPGDFLSVDFLKQKYTKILIYSVLHYLSDERAVVEFVGKALNLLKPGGKLLIGDIPNIDKKNRFLCTDGGAIMSRKWEEEKAREKEHPLTCLPTDNKLLHFNDSVVCSLIKAGRAKGIETYLLPQNTGLPFCNTREDILYVSPR